MNLEERFKGTARRVIKTTVTFLATANVRDPSSS